MLFRSAMYADYKITKEEACEVFVEWIDEWKNRAFAAQGNIAAQESMEKMAEVERMNMLAAEEKIQGRIAKVRKALGLRKNDENPAALCRLIEEWRMQARIRRYNGVW